MTTIVEGSSETSHPAIVLARRVNNASARAVFEDDPKHRSDLGARGTWRRVHRTRVIPSPSPKSMTRTRPSGGFGECDISDRDRIAGRGARAPCSIFDRSLSNDS